AEDGIRDFHVTGVQTCALPIFQSDSSPIKLIQQFTMEILNDLQNGDEYAHFQMLMTQAATIEDPSPQIKQLKKQSEAMLLQTTQIGRASCRERVKISERRSSQQ